MSSVSEKSNFPSTDSDPYFSCSSRVPKAKWSKKQDLVTLENSVGLDSVNELPFINNNNVSQILSNKNQTNSSSTEKFHRWVQLRPFEWETYINPAWDESINSNSFCSKNMQTVFQKRINQLHSKGKLPRAEFPMEEKLCSQMVKFDDSEHLRTYLSQSCLDLAVNNPILDTE